MRNLFPGFYYRSEEEISKLWQDGIFVFDTNMLLNIYRYTKETRERYFEILERLKKQNQLWIPYQVAYEYQDRRIDVIQGQLDAYTKVSNALQTISQSTINALSPYNTKHRFINTENMIEKINRQVIEAKSTVTKSKEKDKKVYEEMKKNDELREKIEELFEGNIGNPYDRVQLEKMYHHAQSRIELKMPPGWEDIDKKSFKMFGDVILWFQLLDFASLMKKPIIFVTDDGKKDWWLADIKSQGQKMPLPDLVQEMHIEAEVLLHMYEGYTFLEQASLFLNLESKPEIIKEAREVTQQNTLENEKDVSELTVPLSNLEDVNERVSSNWADQVENAVKIWMARKFPDFVLSSNGINSKPQYTLTNPRGRKYIEIVRIIGYVPSSYIENTLQNRKHLNINIINNEYIFIIIFSSSLDATRTASKIKKLLDIPENFIVMLAYLNDGNLIIVS